ncbi:hypothetical protein GQ54DRAFT_299662 [Martensiomyces pterosporus]|nr:hypothetical protein GQ54DRAFT_299662 [Martensiomyces pterosporus]
MEHLCNIDLRHFSLGFVTTIQTILSRGGILSCIETRDITKHGLIRQVRINTREPDGEWYHRCLTEHNYHQWAAQKTLLRKEDVFPKAKGMGFKTFDHTKHSPKDVHIKLVNLAYAGCIPNMREAFVEEIATVERASKLNHPGIAEYYGCVVENGLITGIAMKRYVVSLEQALGKSGIRCSKFSSQSLVYAATALERLDMCVSTIKPSDVMLDQEGSLVLVDMDCAFPGWWMGGTKKWNRNEHCGSPQPSSDSCECCYPLKQLFSRICSKVCIETRAADKHGRPQHTYQASVTSCKRPVCCLDPFDDDPLEDASPHHVHELWRSEKVDSQH